MKILKPGKVEERKFVCPVCGCIFTASKNELETDGLSGTFSTICPNLECGEHITDVRGEPYEEPTPTISDVERLKNLIMRIVRETKNWSWADLARGLIQNGVTFREGGE